MRLLVVSHGLAHSLSFEDEDGPQLQNKPMGLSSAHLGAQPILGKMAASEEARAAKKNHRRRRSASSLLSSINLSAEPKKGPLHSSWKFTGHTAHPSAAIALNLPEGTEALFVGWPGPLFGSDGNKLDYTELPSETLQFVESIYLKECKSVPVFLGSKEAAGHLKYCNEALWPILHYAMWDRGEVVKLIKENWPHFVRVNELFAECILANYRSGDVIWILDYHLMLLPAILRRKLESTPIGWYLRATFPSSELFRCLPQAEELLQGVLSANIIGLQTHSYARHFTSCCTRILGLESTGLRVEADLGPVKLCIVPTGNAPDRVSAAMQSTLVLEKLSSFRGLYSGKRVILSIERVNQVSAAKHALRAFHFLLSKHPEIEDVIFVLVILPEEDTDELSEPRRFILEEANRINSLFGTIGQSPVQLHFQNLELEEYYALLAVADIFLVANERDSLSNIPLDYIVCQGQKMGPLILSEFTALASSISTATILVNPWDYVDLAGKIDAALSAPIEERRIDYQRLLKYVKDNSEAHWVWRFLQKLDSCKETMHRYGPTSYISSAAVKEAYDRCTDRYLFLDYDGTLAPIVSVPSAASPGPAAVDSLRRLCSNPRNHVYIISGRDRSVLDAWLGDIEGLGMSAEHGCFLKHAGSEEWASLCPISHEEWQTEVLRIFEYFTIRTPGSFIERKSVAVTWHYRQADPEFGVSQAKQCQTLLEQMVCGKCPVEVIVGKKNLEVRPQAINKGGVLRTILGDLIGTESSEAQFIFCAGDDRTDEDMFRFLQDTPSESVFTCAIGPANKRTAAKFHVNNPDQLLHLLYNLAE